MNITFKRWRDGHNFHFVLVDDCAVGWLDIGDQFGTCTFTPYFNEAWHALMPDAQTEVRTAATNKSITLAITKRLTA